MNLTTQNLVATPLYIGCHLSAQVPMLALPAEESGQPRRHERLSGRTFCRFLLACLANVSLPGSVGSISKSPEATCCRSTFSTISGAESKTCSQPVAFTSFLISAALAQPGSGGQQCRLAPETNVPSTSENCARHISLGPVGASPYSVVWSPLVNLSGILEAPVDDE